MGGLVGGFVGGLVGGFVGGLVGALVGGEVADFRRRKMMRRSQHHSIKQSR